MTDGHLFTNHDDRDLLDAAGVLEHRLKVVLIGFYVNVLGVIPVRRPGVGCEGSTGLSVYDDLFRHDCALRLSSINFKPSAKKMTRTDK